MIPRPPGHPPRDIGTGRADRGTVGLGLEERAVLAPPARRLTPAGLGWAAAGLATVLAVATALLAVRGRDVSGFLVPIAVGYAWMGCVLLARRPGHPMGPLLCLIGLANAISGFAYTAFQYMSHPQRLGDPPYVFVFAFECKRR